MAYRPDPKILGLGPEFYDPVDPARFPKAIPRFLNQRWAERVGLDLDDGGWEAHFCRFEPLARQSHPAAGAALSRPSVPRVQSGDRRRPRLPLRAASRRCGRTARPRHQGLGPDALQPPRRRPADAQRRRARSARDRDARGAGRRDVEELRLVRNRRGARARRRALADPLGGADAAQPRPHPHRHLPAPGFLRRGRQHREARPLLPRQSLRRAAATIPLRLFDLVSQATATLAASYLAAGFVHGVLNSDNINITGESFDYGPWRFTPEWDPDFTAAYFDHYGLYSFARQPEAIHWDLAQFAGALSLIAEAPQAVRTARRVERALRSRAGRRDAAPARIGDDGDDQRCRRADQGAGVARGADRPRLLRLARRPRSRRRAYPSDAFRALAKALEGRSRAAHAPILVRPGALLDAYRGGRGDLVGDCERDDWQPFEDKVRAIRRMGEAMEQDAPAS